MKNCLSCGCPLTTKKLGGWKPGEGFTCKECSSRRLSMNKSHRAMRARRLARVDGGIRRHHRQQQINERLRSI